MRSRTLPCCKLAGKASQLCVPALFMTISSCWLNQRWWTIWRYERHTSICIIEWSLYGPGRETKKKLSALRNSKVSAFGSIFKYWGASIKWPHKRGDHYWECLLWEVPLSCFPKHAHTTAVGTLNQTQATEYCFTVNDVVLLDSPVSENIK